MNNKISKYDKVDDALSILYIYINSLLPLNLQLALESVLNNYLVDITDEELEQEDQDTILTNIEDMLGIDIKKILGERDYDKLYWKIFKTINK